MPQINCKSSLEIYLFIVGHTITGDSKEKNRLRKELEELKGAENINQPVLKCPDIVGFVEKIKKVCQEAEQKVGKVSFEKGDCTKIYYNPHLYNMTTASTGKPGIDNRIIEKLVHGNVDGKCTGIHGGMRNMHISIRY